MNKYNIKKDDIWQSSKNGRKIRVYGLFSNKNMTETGEDYVAWIYLDECPLKYQVDPVRHRPAVWDIDTFARIFKKSKA